MQTKEELVSHIRNWLAIENDIKDLRKLLREKTEKKKQLSNELLSVMKENDIDCFDITNGKLMTSKIKIKETVSKKMLLRVLTDYLDKPEEVVKLTDYILDSRTVKEKEYIRQKINK
tara:strand:+ start:293 stop:643 length:351 start_codon:yes stop_codon:yes gene_type:complete